MKIDEFNGKIINTEGVNIHDDILDQLIFFREQRRLSLSIIKEKTIDVYYKIDFINVVGFEMTNCDFWGHSPHILDFEYVEESKRTLLPRLKKEIEKYPFVKFSNLNDEVSFLETIITFTSGDTLKIVCECIILN